MRLQRRSVVGEKRRWDEMNHDVLVNIIQRLEWREWAMTVCYMCRSWLAALLDVIHPPGGLLDLSPLGSIQNGYARRRYRHYLKLALDRRPPTTIWSKLRLPDVRLRDEFYLFIAERLPSLRCLIIPPKRNIYPLFLWRLISYWKNLRSVHAHGATVCTLSYHCKNICHLSLYGQIGDTGATHMAKFPRLKRLVIQSCMLSMNALSIILDGHKNLELLDTRHCYRIVLGGFPRVRVTEWNEEEIRQKTAGIKKHLQCARKNCPECLHLY